MENVRNRIRVELFKTDNTKDVIKQQSKLIFNGIHKSYGNCDIYSFRQIEVKLDKPIYLGFAASDMSKLHMYETYYD